MERHKLRKKCPYSELFWSVFSRIRIEYGEIRSISPYSVRMRENTDQKLRIRPLFMQWQEQSITIMHIAKNMQPRPQNNFNLFFAFLL